MASEVEISNLILVPLGVDRISSLSEDSPQAKTMNQMFASLRDRELVSHTWSFATDRVQLAQTANTPAFGYSLEFQLPADSLRVINIDTNDYGYRVEGDKLLTDWSTPYVRYIKRITDTNRFTQAFIEVLVARGQYELCYSLTGSKTLLKSLFDVYVAKRRLHVGVDSQAAGTPYGLYSDRLRDSRYGSIR
jgi:hypothetical protein